jgi:uncharacterized repeat protein (TIGR03803 family)
LAGKDWFKIIDFHALKMKIAVFMKTSLKNHLITLSLKSVIASVIMASASLVGAQTLQTLVSFDRTNNGADPLGGLTLGKDGNFYGTTRCGGTNCYPFASDGPYWDDLTNDCGTLFKVTTNGTLTTLYQFGTLALSRTFGVPNIVPTNGCGPNALTLGNDGNFYGTTVGSDGGTEPVVNGTVFKMTTNGTITTLNASFPGGDRGPWAGLTLGNDGNFYGSLKCGGADAGGGNTLGSVFKVTTNGTVTTLVSFTYTDFPNGDNNGYWVQAALTLGNDGNLYGSTKWGGPVVPELGQGYGTLFKVTTNGTLIWVVYFNYDNGAYPVGALTLGNDGNFYGTTEQGGIYGAGTVFKMTPDGTVTTLASLDGDNAWPQSTLALGKDGNFYGTSYFGGGMMYGSVFKVTTNGVVTTLVTFTGDNGVYPFAGLTLGKDGNFYGTTRWGGSNNCGTVFRLNLPLPVSSVVLSQPVWDELDWTYSGPAPDHWRVEYSSGPSGPWEFDRNIAGGLNSCYVDIHAIYLRIVAQDSNNHNVSLYSNVIFVISGGGCG